MGFPAGEFHFQDFDDFLSHVVLLLNNHAVVIGPSSEGSPTLCALCAREILYARARAIATILFRSISLFSLHKNYFFR
jgi:hypothetical protein